MNVKLTPELERFVAEKVRRGTYATTDEVVADALIRLKNAGEMGNIHGEALRTLIAAGQEDADKGELVDAETVFEELRQTSKQRRAGKKHETR